MAGIDNNTVLYLRGDSFKDLSPNPKTITSSGVAISDNCLEFGTAKRLIVGSSSEFAFGSGDFTVEVDAYLTAYSETDIFVSDTNFKDFYFNVSERNRKLRFDATYGPHYSKNTVPLNTWNHLCVTRKDGIVYLFINGKLEFNGVSNGVIYMTSPRIGYPDAYPNDKITGKLKNIRVSNIARYTEDFTPPTQPFNSININVTNKTFSQIDFNVTELGQETINKVEVLVNNIVSETYTDNFDNLTYNIDNSLCAMDNNKITIRVTYDDNYVEEEILTHTVTVDKLPTTSSLKDVIDRQELLNNSIEVQKNNLKNILVGKNVEVTEEDKMSDLIEKVDLLGEYDDGKLWLYKDGDECIDISGGFSFFENNYNGGSVNTKSISMEDSYIYASASRTSTSGSWWHYISTKNKIDLTGYNFLKCEITTNIPSLTVGNIVNSIYVDNLQNPSGMTNYIQSVFSNNVSNNTEIVTLNISNINSIMYCGFRLCQLNASNGSANVKIHKIWLEK